MHVVCVIVHFPGSKVKLTDLPEGCFPIVPVSWTFTTLLKDDHSVERKIRVTRYQIPIPPAFAVTGHSAHGKTLPSVLVNLHEGGFAAYVAASRARSREGLCIMAPVTLNQLNKPLPSDLVREVRRFDAIEHNTYIRSGLIHGQMIPVPDAEAEMEMGPAKVSATFEHDLRPATNKKRTAEENCSPLEVDVPARKRRRG
jgi:hypothetical protein